MAKFVNVPSDMGQQANASPESKQRVTKIVTQGGLRLRVADSFAIIGHDNDFPVRRIAPYCRTHLPSDLKSAILLKIERTPHEDYRRGTDPG